MPDASKSTFANLTSPSNKCQNLSDLPSTSSSSSLSSSKEKESTLETTDVVAVNGNDSGSSATNTDEIPTEVTDASISVQMETDSEGSPKTNSKEETEEKAEDNEFRRPFYLEKIKTDLYEDNRGYVIVRILLVKPESGSVGITFEEQSMEVEFKTKEEKLLATYNQDRNTTFVWQTKLAEEIIPSECSWSIKNVIEIKLKKKDAKLKWTSVAPPVVKEPSNNTAASRKYRKYTDNSDDDSNSMSTCDFYDRSGENENDKASNNGPVHAPFFVSKKPKSPVVKTEPGYTGLRNIGNTCFMNASLQALINTVELKSYFCRNYHFFDINVKNPLGMKGELAAAFGDFMKDIWSGNHRAVEPSAIKSLVSHKANQFSNFAQHDAQEFLSFLLDVLHEDLNRVATKPITEPIESDGRPDSVIAELSWRNCKSRDDSLIVDLFHGQYKSRLHCPECKRVSITFDPFVYLTVPFPKAKNNSVLRGDVDESNENTATSEPTFFTFQGEEKSRCVLTDLLQMFTEPETLGPQEAWYCNKCKKHQEAEKTLLLWTLPPLLIIQLKRFYFAAHSFRSKNDTMVDYPVNGLDLARYLCPGAPAQPTVYDLYAVVCHSGSAFFGHYISYGRLVDAESEKTEIDWRLFDDSVVSHASETDVVDGKAYLLFYRRRDFVSNKLFENYRNKQDLIEQKQTEFEKGPRFYYSSHNNEVD